MNDTVEKLIAARQPHVELPLTPVNVRHVPIGIANRCYGNACRTEEMMPTAQMVSGWLVGKHDPRARITPIIAHWWNRCGDEHIDTTPLGDEWVHVLDLNIMRYAYQNDEILSTHVPSSLAHNGDGFLLAVGTAYDELEFLPVAHLSDDVLFAHCRTSD